MQLLQDNKGRVTIADVLNEGSDFYWLIFMKWLRAQMPAFWARDIVIEAEDEE
jgi:hypothetical protein